MTSAPDTALAPDAPLEEIQDAILDRLHAGLPVDRRAWLQRHAAHADALGRFFELLDLIETPPGAAHASQAPGRLGDFEILREIGRGGMGLVYEARQLSLNRRVALKVLPPEVRQDRQRLLRFRREAEAAGRLRHPNIVPVYAISEPGAAPFFAMELVEGRSLAGILRARRAGDNAGLPPVGAEWQRWCLGVGVKIAEALAYAHGQGILHRDVKPGNILIDSDGAPRLTDFGLALDLDTTSLTVSGEVFGSPRYMSPEQARMREHPIDARTDIYSLAVTLYELLTLKMPYTGNTSADILASLSSGRIVPACVADPSLPADIERILMHALQNDPEERYVGAAELAGDLAAVLEGSCPAAAPKRWKRGCRREPRSAAIKLVFTIAAVLVGLVLGLALFMVVVALIGVLFLGTSADAPRVDAEALAAVADGTHADPEAVLSGWLDVHFDTRSVVSRGEPGQALFGLSSWVPADAPADLVLLMHPEVSVDGGPFVGPPAPDWTEPLQPGLGEEFQYSVPLTSLVGEALDGDVLRVTPRVSVRLARRPPAGAQQDPARRLQAADIAGGGTWSWYGSPRTLAVYDRYPDDYPAAVSGPETDTAMLAAATPDHVVYQRLASFAPGERSIELLLHFGHERRGPLPVAYEVELWPVDGTAPVGRGRYTCAAFPAEGNVPPAAAGTAMVLFELPQEPGADEPRLLLDLEAGRVETLRLVFTPSREVALSEPLFDRYWDVPLDMALPVEPSPVPRR